MGGNMFATNKISFAFCVTASATLLITLSTCDCNRSVNCGFVDPLVSPLFPYDVSGMYEERVNCSEDNMCVTQDESQMIEVTADSEDPTQFAVFNRTIGFTALGTLCQDRLEWAGESGAITERGIWTFGAEANTYTRASQYTRNNPGTMGDCTGSGSRVGKPGPPEAVGTCPTGGGGAGGGGGTGGTDCVPFANDVGGSGTTAVYWEEVYTCVDGAGNCVGTERTEVTLALLQDGSEVDWEIVDGEGQGSEFSGELCDTSFWWTSKPGTPAEDGCWEFTADRFNKRSYGAGFYCVGAASKGGGSTPDLVPTCAELATANVDYTECPPQPPASPID